MDRRTLQVQRTEYCMASSSTNHCSDAYGCGPLARAIQSSVACQSRDRLNHTLYIICRPLITPSVHYRIRWQKTYKSHLEPGSLAQYSQLQGGSIETHVARFTAQRRDASDEEAALARTLTKLYAGEPPCICSPASYLIDAVLVVVVLTL